MTKLVFPGTNVNEIKNKKREMESSHIEIILAVIVEKRTNE